MQEEDKDTSVTNEDTEILNLPLYTERKADSPDAISHVSMGF